jgi:hypothetical protein
MLKKTGNRRATHRLTSAILPTNFDQGNKGKNKVSISGVSRLRLVSLILLFDSKQMFFMLFSVNFQGAVI